jgi:GDP-4-dehydro-6-deoxy-D-mannose reductase
VRVLITGASGFAGTHLARACATAGDEVTGTSRGGQASGTVALDLRDAQASAALIAEVRPEIVYHLAALSHVGRSWEEPRETFEANALGAVNLLEAIRREAPSARVIWVSSCEVYGRAPRLPVDEGAPLNPATPYAVSKAAGDQLAGIYAEAHGLEIVRVRPFNHAGPGQGSSFLVSSLARQGAEARRAGAAHLKVITGNPETRRDFTDVRDVVRAYRAVARSGVPTEVYNVASGVSVSAAEQVELLAGLLAPIEVEHVVDPAKVRAHEVMDHRGSPARIEAACGWRPEIPLRQTLADTMAWWERRLGPGGV